MRGTKIGNPVGFTVKFRVTVAEINCHYQAVFISVLMVRLKLNLIVVWAGEPNETKDRLKAVFCFDSYLQATLRGAS
jgi:hypothetical protein